MRKIAIFVEGLTEQLFAEKLVTSLVADRVVSIELTRRVGNFVQIKVNFGDDNADAFVLIADCASDGQVKTQIRDRYKTLVAAGYDAIIGLRDVYPLERSDVPKLQAMLSVGIPEGPLVPEMFLAVMEVEAWFLAERTHFERIDKKLSEDFIVDNGIDIVGTRSHDWDHPADTLDKIYQLAGARYVGRNGKKIGRRLRRTVNALSFDEVCGECCVRVPELNRFIESIERALAA